MKSFTNWWKRTFQMMNHKTIKPNDEQRFNKKKKNSIILKSSLNVNFFFFFSTKIRNLEMQYSLNFPSFSLHSFSKFYQNLNFSFKMLKYIYIYIFKK